MPRYSWMLLCILFLLSEIGTGVGQELSVLISSTSWIRLGADLAIRHFQTRNDSVIKEFGTLSDEIVNMTVEIQITEWDFARTVRLANDLVQRGTQVIVGPGRSVSTVGVASIDNAVPCISYSATSASLSSYKNIFRTVVDDSVGAAALVNMAVHEYSWKHIAVIYDASDTYSRHYGQELLHSNDITGAHFPVENSDDASMLETVMDQVASSGIKTITCIMPTKGSLGRATLAANRSGLLGPDYGWLMTDVTTYVDDPVVLDLLDGTKVFVPTRCTDANPTWDKYWTSLKPMDFPTIPSTPSTFTEPAGLGWSASIYDAVAGAVISLNRTQSADRVGGRWIRDTQFDGASGYVGWDMNGNLREQAVRCVSVLQIRDGTLEDIGIFSSNNATFNRFDVQEIWHQGTLKMPIDTLECPEGLIWDNSGHRCILHIGLFMRVTNAVGEQLSREWVRINAAAHLAIQHVESHNFSFIGLLGNHSNASDIIPVKSTLYDTRSSERGGLIAFGNAFEEEVKVIVGAARSAVSMPVALMGRIFEIPQVSYWSTSPSLSDTILYPYFSRTIPDDAVNARMAANAMKHLGFRRVGMIHINDSYGNDYARVFGNRCLELGIVAITLPFTTGDKASAEVAVGRAATLGLRIVVAVMFDIDHDAVVFKADDVGLLQPGRAFIGTDSFTLTAVESSSDPARLERLMHGMFRIRGVSVGPNHDAMMREWRTYRPESFPGVPNIDVETFQEDIPQTGLYAYDAVWASVLAYSNVIRNGAAGTAAAFTKELSRTTFVGASGAVEFTPDGDRTNAQTLLENIVLNEQNNIVAQNYAWIKDGQLQVEPGAVPQWPGGGVPHDGFCEGAGFEYSAATNQCEPTLVSTLPSGPSDESSWWTRQRTMAVAIPFGIVAALIVIGLMAALVRSRREAKRVGKRDAENRKQREIEKLVMAKQLAESSNVNKQKFLRYLMHEIRVPFHVVTVGVDTVLDDEISADHRDILMAVQSSSSMIGALLNDVLDLQRIEEGKFDLECNTVHVGNLLHQVHSSFAVIADDKGVKLVDEGVSPRDGGYHGDPNRLQQAVSNLVSNALKFTTDGGRVSMQAKVSPVSAVERSEETIEALTDLAESVPNPPNGTLLEAEYVMQLTVQDTGTGIAKSDLPKLFKTFSQIDAGELQKGKGSGLGLSITKAIVELHGGTVHVDSVLDVGSTFVISLPWTSPTLVPIDLSPNSLSHSHVSKSRAPVEEISMQALPRRPLGGRTQPNKSDSFLVSSVKRFDASAPLPPRPLGLDHSLGLSPQITPANASSKVGDADDAGLAPHPLARSFPGPISGSFGADDAGDGSVSSDSAGGSGVSAGTSAGVSGVSAGSSAGVSGVSAGSSAGVSGVGAGTSAGVSGVSAGSSAGVSGVSAGSSAGVSGVSGASAVFSSAECLHTWDIRKALLVDDVDMVLKITKRAIEKLGIDVETANNGKVALEKVHATADTNSSTGCGFDLVFMDKEMPIMDGFEACKQLTKQFPDLPIIGVTGNALTEDVDAFKACGVDDVITKPMKLATLPATIDKVFLRRHLNKEKTMSQLDLDFSDTEEANGSSSNFDTEAVLDAEIPDESLPHAIIANDGQSK